MPQGTQPDSRPEIGRLMEQYGSSLLRMSALYLKDADLAQDAVQETFIKAYRHFSEYRGESSEKTWLTAIAMNVSRDMLKSAWFRHHDRRIVPEELPIPAEENLQPEESDDLGRAILELPVKYKDVILLYYYQDMNQDEIAEVLRVSAPTVSRRLKRAQEKLRDVLKGGREDE